MSGGSNWRGTTTFARLWEFQNGCCFFCERKLSDTAYERKKNSRGYTREHFLPRFAGFNNRGNNVISCYYCNNNKQDCDPTYYECVAFVDLWEKMHLPEANILINPIWNDFIEELKLIRRLSKMIGLPCP